jgi:hypothetical protein
MASGPLGSRPSKKSPQELDRIIGRLNDNFALQLSKPDVTLSPRKSREIRRNDEEARVDNIYRRIQQLYYTGDNRLAAYLGHFEQRGRIILSESASRSPGNRTPAANRTLLQKCLLDILCEIEDPESRQWSKREFEAVQMDSPKRAKGRLYEHHDAVDALPVRSRESFANISTVISSVSRSQEEAFRPLPQQRSFDRTFFSTRTSFHSEVYSTQAQNESFISQTSVGSELPSSNHPYSQIAVGDSFSEASASTHDEIVPKRVSDISPRRKEEPDGRSQYPGDSQSQVRASSSSQSRQNNRDIVGKPLEERFANIWRTSTHLPVVSQTMANNITI